MLSINEIKEVINVLFIWSGYILLYLGMGILLTVVFYYCYYKILNFGSNIKNHYKREAIKNLKLY